LQLHWIKGKNTTPPMQVRLGLWFNATVNTISVMSWRSVLLVEKTADHPQVTDKLYHITLFRVDIVGILWDFKNCVTDNLFWAKLLYFGVFVKEIIQKLFLNHFIGKLSNSSIFGVKFQFCQIFSFQADFLAQMHQA